MSKYKVGDKVKVREDLDLGHHGVIDSMLKYKGEEVTIKCSHHNGEYNEYRFEEIPYTWTDDCIVKSESKYSKYVKCIDNRGSAFNVLELNKIYQVIDMDIVYYELKDNQLWNKSRFEEMPNPQNPVKSSVSEPLKSNKLELLMPVLDIIERLQELEIDKSSIDDIVSKIESEETKQEEIKYYENKITILEEENSKLQKENTFLYSYITKISEMTRTCIIDRL